MFSILIVGGLVGIIAGFVTISRQEMNLPPAGSFEDDDENGPVTDKLTGREAIKGGLYLIAGGILCLLFAIVLAVSV